MGLQVAIQIGKKRSPCLGTRLEVRCFSTPGADGSPGCGRAEVPAAVPVYGEAGASRSAITKGTTHARQPDANLEGAALALASARRPSAGFPRAAGGAAAGAAESGAGLPCQALPAPAPARPGPDHRLQPGGRRIPEGAEGPDPGT